jgi:5'-3' exonuclease
MTVPERVWLIDASIYIFRAWFTWPETLVNQRGQQVNAVLGFIAFVDDFLARENPQKIAFAFDESKENSYRNSIYSEYKANRESAPDNLKFQFQLCRQYIRSLGIVEAASSRYEADDLIATWADQSEFFTVVTADKDLTQLLRLNVESADLWCDYQKQITLDYKAVIKKFGVRPDQIADQLALAGDKVDNIPGVPGVGMATAAKLLRRFDSVDVLLESIDKIGEMKFRGSLRVQSLIQEYQQQIRQYCQVTVVVRDVPELETDLTRKLVTIEARDAYLQQCLLVDHLPATTTPNIPLTTPVA